ncbi:MAG: amidohydrolase family protein [Actinomycetota bacterium]|nr:amidohydrolase family protein [Actinomycetota bacterium]
MKIIDCLCNLPTLEGIIDQVVGLPPQMTEYLRNVFGPRVAPMFGLTAEELARAKEEMNEEELWKYMEPKVRHIAQSEEQFISTLDSWGVEIAVLFNFDEETVSGVRGLTNDYYAGVVSRHPDRLRCFAGVDPHKGMDAVREVERAVKELGLHGVALRPFMQQIPADHRKFYPIYAKCVELGVPVWIHTSISYASLPMYVAHPSHLDQVCLDFPELKVVAGHGGWPWTAELVAVAWRHPNLYIDFSSVRPRYVGRHNTSWEPLVEYGNSILADRIVFGSTWLYVGMSVPEMVEEIKQMPLKEGILEKWLYHNAARLLGIEQE